MKLYSVVAVDEDRNRNTIGVFSSYSAASRVCIRLSGVWDEDDELTFLTEEFELDKIKTDYGYAIEDWIRRLENQIKELRELL